MQKIKLLETSSVNVQYVTQAANRYGTPLYLYDESVIKNKCREILTMPNAFGLQVRYAMKANANMSLLELIVDYGLDLDISSVHEGRRAALAGIRYNRMMLTSQDVPLGEHQRELEKMMRAGLTYTVCSLRQLDLVAHSAARMKASLAIRIHPGFGSGESATRNTGDRYSCFGIHECDIPAALQMAQQSGVRFNQLHLHFGSGSDPHKWRVLVTRALEVTEKYFPNIEILNLGGGFKVARMPHETAADIKELGLFAEQKFKKFCTRTGRKLVLAVEPGTFIVANAGFLVTRVIDIKSTGPSGYKFLVLDGGIEANPRPLLYGSQHPFYVISQAGELRSAENELTEDSQVYDEFVVVGRCCETGDTQCIDPGGRIQPRRMATPQIDDIVVIGGVGAYCSSMAPSNYNSYSQPVEVLLRLDGTVHMVRKRQTIEQIIINEYPLWRIMSVASSAQIG